MKSSLKPLSIIAFLAISGFSIWQYNTRFLSHKILAGIGIVATLSAYGYCNKKIIDDMQLYFDNQVQQKTSKLSNEISELNDIISGLNCDIDLKNAEQIKLENDWKLRLENSINVLKAEIVKRENIIKQKEDELEKACDTWSKEFNKVHETYTNKVAEHNKTVQEFYDWKKQQEESMRNAYFMLDKRQFESSNEHKEQLEKDRIQLKQWERNLIEVERQLNEKEATFIAQQKDYQYSIENQKLMISELSENVQQLEAERMLLMQQLNELQGGLNPDSLEFALVGIIRQQFRAYGYNLVYKQIESKTENRITFWFDASEDDKIEILKKDIHKALSDDKFNGKPVRIKRNTGYLEIDVPFESVNSNQKKVEFIPGQVKHNQIENFIRSINHLLLIGSTGNGKSTLISNVLEVASDVLSGIPELIILNPKPTAVAYSFNGKIHKANYLNIEQPEGCFTPDCRVGLMAVLDDLRYRMIAGQKAIENDEPFPKFQPRIYLFEEANLMNSRIKELWQECIELLGRLGREFDLIGIVVGQEATIKEYGFNSRSFVQNFSRIYLKSALNLDVVANTELKYLANKDEIERDIQQHKINVGSSKVTQFYGLFIEQGNSNSFVSYLPEPSYYYNQINNVNCISCGSTEVKKDGKRGDEQYHRCSDCGKQFSQSQWKSYLNQSE